jgi:hypothetical protein
MAVTGEAVTACLFAVATVLWLELFTRCRALLPALGCLYALMFCGASTGLWLVRWAALP